MYSGILDCNYALCSISKIQAVDWVAVQPNNVTISSRYNIYDDVGTCTEKQIAVLGVNTEGQGIVSSVHAGLISYTQAICSYMKITGADHILLVIPN